MVLYISRHRHRTHISLLHEFYKLISIYSNTVTVYTYTYSIYNLNTNNITIREKRQSCIRLRNMNFKFSQEGIAGIRHYKYLNIFHLPKQVFTTFVYVQMRTLCVIDIIPMTGIWCTYLTACLNVQVHKNHTINHVTSYTVIAYWIHSSIIAYTRSSDV